MTVRRPAIRLAVAAEAASSGYFGVRKRTRVNGAASSQRFHHADVLSQNLLQLTDGAMASIEQAFSFGPFHLIPAQRLLFEGQRPLRLGSRAMDILIALVERPGELISKKELMERVWPSTVVVEANLAVHVAALRRALGDGQNGNRYVVNVPGRGYCFVAEVNFPVRHNPAAHSAMTGEHVHKLPVSVTRFIGRADIVDIVAAQMRLVTLVGLDGIEAAMGWSTKHQARRTGLQRP